MVNILRSKFLLIIGILVLLSSIVIPAVTALSPAPAENGYPGPIMYEKAMAISAYDGKPMYPGGYYDGQEPITVDGVVIKPDNPMYWSLLNIQQQRQALQDGSMQFANTQSSVIALDVLDVQEDFYMHFAKNITDPSDYRMEYQWNAMTKLGDKILYENNDKDPAALLEVSQMYGLYWDTQENFNKKYINITSEEKIAGIDKADEFLTKVYDMLDNNNFAVYIDLSIQQQMDYVASNEDQIAIYEQNIIDNPEQEEAFSQQIIWLQNQNKQIMESVIPLLQYRLEKNIIPNTDAWQNSAISELQSAQSYLLGFMIISEEDFNKPDNQYLKNEYGTYYNYKSQMEAQKLQYENMELVAQNSLDAEKPDMKFVPDGSRSATVGFLYYSIIVALFAVLIGGWIMGSEFQLGTIRLLLIRPKTRTKIMMSKFAAALALCLGLYIAGCVLNIVANGICFGFSDFAFPNYNVAGGINFFAFYIPEMLASAVPIVFGFSVAFMLSMLVKNIAVSIAIPVICFVGCYLLMDSLTSHRIISWLAYTPIPYVQMYAFFMPSSTISYMPLTRYVEPSSITQLLQRGMPLDVVYGIILLLALSAVCVLVSIFTFRKRDITN